MTFVFSQLRIPSACDREWGGKQTQKGKVHLKCHVCPWSSPQTLLGREGLPFKRAVVLQNGIYSILHSRVKNTILVPYHFPPLSTKYLKWKWLLSTPETMWEMTCAQNKLTGTVGNFITPSNLTGLSSSLWALPNLWQLLGIESVNVNQYFRPIK